MLCGRPHWGAFGGRMKKVFLFILFVSHAFLYLFATELYNDFIIGLDNKNYYLVAYFDTLYKSDRNALKSIFPESNLFKDTIWDEPDGTVIHKWYEENFFPFEKIQLVKTLSNTISNNRMMLGKGIIIDIKTLQKEKDETIISFQEKHYGEEADWYFWYFWSFLDWTILRKSNSNTLIFVEDGDYLYLYYDKDIKYPFTTYARMDDESLEQFKNLIYNNKCDLSKVTWPRHADGSCDYDGSKKTSAVQTAKTTTSTNVTKNKTMTVTENLKLRSGEATTTQVLTVMSAGTKVKILELGKSETIDSINSYWVKVEVQAGAKDKEGKDIKKGIVGWCYGGYLK